MMKTTETREQTLTRLARDSAEGAGAANRFKSLFKRVLKTPKSEIDARAKEWKKSRSAEQAESE